MRGGASRILGRRISVTQVIAHRGAPVQAPENTLASFRKGIEAGCDILELDVRLTKDGKLAVIHDATVDRTTDGSGAVADLRWDELRTLRANKGWEAEFPEERIPSLDEVLELLDSRITLNIEIKNADPEDVATAEAVLAWIDRVDFDTERLLVSCFDRPALLRIAELHPAVPLAIPFKRMPSDLGTLPVGTWHPRYNIVDEGLMSAARTQGKRVNVWTVDDLTEQERLIALGVHGIMTNDPASLRHRIERP